MQQNDALPVVAIKSVLLTSGDTLIVSGTIVKQGAAPIQYEGICYGIDSNPAMEENQRFISSSNTNFTFAIKLKPDSTYFVRVFATNSYGYGLSRPASTSVPHQKPPTVPCTLTDMKINDHGFKYTITSAYINPSNIANYGSFESEADYSVGAMTMDFWGRPANGVYVTQVDGGQFSTDRSSKEVYVQLNEGNIYSMNTGDSVYVTENADSSLSFSFCAIHYYFGSTNLTVSGKYTAK